MFAFKSPLALLPMIFSPLSPVLAQRVDEVIAERSASNTVPDLSPNLNMTIFYVTPGSTCDTTTMNPEFYKGVPILQVAAAYMDACNTGFTEVRRDIWGMFFSGNFRQSVEIWSNCSKGLEIISWHDCSKCDCDDDPIKHRVSFPRTYSPTYTGMCVAFNQSQKSFRSHCIT